VEGDRVNFPLTTIAASLRPATVIVVDDPFTIVPDARACRLRQVRYGETLQDLAPAEPGAWLCIVDGEAIPRRLWHCMPHPGSVVQFRALPQGGGRGGSNPLRMLLQIAAMVAINFLIPGAGFAMQLARLGATIAANALIANLVPLDQTNASTGGGAATFNAQAQGNVARLGQPIPDVHGFDNGFPDLAAPPYSTYIDNEQYLHLLLIVTQGRFRIDRVSVGDTPIGNFSEATVVRIGPAQDTMDGPGAGIESLDDLELAIVDPRWITSADVSGVEMKPLDNCGPYAACPSERTVDRIGVDIALPKGLTIEGSMEWIAEARLVNDDDQALGSWFTLGSHTYSTESNIPVRLSNEYAVDAGRYQVRVRRTDNTGTTDPADMDMLSWLALRGRVVDAELAVDDATFVAIRIRASGQLSGALRFRVMGRRMLPFWDGIGWTIGTAHRNAAWSFAHVLRSRGVPDEQIDLDTLLYLADVWDERQDRFDHRFDTQISMWDALTMIARVGRAVPLMRGGRYTMVRDEPKGGPIAAFGMRNIRRNSVQIKPKLPTSDSMLTLDMEYFDHRRWAPVTVTAQIHAGTVYAYRGDANRPAGVPAPDANRRGRIKMPGIYGTNHALRTVAYTLADRYYRDVDIDYDTELDGLLPAPLDQVVFQHDLGNFGQTGDVVTWDDGALTLTTTEPLQWVDGLSHAMRLVRPNGSLTAAIAVTPGGDEYTAVLDAAPGFDLVFDDAARERTRYVFGPTAAVGALVVVRGIKPTSERAVSHRVVIDDDRVHTVDGPWLPTGEEQDPLPDGAPVDDGGSSVVINLTDFEGAAISPGATIDFRFTLHPDGRLSRGFATDPPIIGYLPYQWHNPQPVSAEQAALYEVHVSVTSDLFGVTYGGAALDTWHSLGSARAFTGELMFVGGNNGWTRWTVQIRDAATHMVQDTSVISFYVNDNTP
jgi:hypothetical protein